MQRIVRFVLLIGLLSGAPFVPAQNSESAPAHVPPAAAQTAASVPAAPSIPEEVTAAETAISNSDWKSAEAKLDPYLATHPADPRALFDAAYVADAQNRLDDAAALYRRSIDADPKSFESHISLGLLLARLHRLDEARPELVTATTLDPGVADPALKARAWRALARIDRDANPTAASSELLEALKLTPETADDTLLAAEIAEHAGQDEPAAAAYHRALAADPASIAANAGLAHLLIRREEYAEAETLLRGALEKNPDDPTLTAQLATVLVDEDKAEALPLLQKLHESHPNDADMTRMLAAALADAGDYEGADKLCQQLLSAKPNDARLLVAHGQNLVHLSLLAQAYTAFDKASQIDPANGDAWSGLAFAASRTSHPDVTIHALTMRSRTQPENASTLFLWATAYDSLHQKQQAAVYYHRFIEASGGKYPDQEWQAKQRLQLLGK